MDAPIRARTSTSEVVVLDAPNYECPTGIILSGPDLQKVPHSEIQDFWRLSCKLPTKLGNKTISDNL